MTRGWWRMAAPVVVLLAAVACDGTWAQYGYDGGLSGFNAEARGIGPVEVGGLTESFRVTAGANLGMWSSPVVSDGVGYAIGGLNRLVAFDATPSASCTGTPLVCPPRWTGHAYGGAQPAAPAVVDGTVFVTNTSGPSLVAYDAAGTVNCTGVPKTCEPRWTSVRTGGAWGSPTVVGGRVYLTDRDRGLVESFDAAGVEGCSGTPTTCVALWEGTIGPSYATVAVVGASAYVLDTDGVLSVFDTTGVGCSGATFPQTCVPRWKTAALGSTLAFPVVSGGSVFVAAGAKLHELDANGQQGCSGSPTVCVPRWTAVLGGTMPTQGSPAVAYGRVFVGGQTGPVGFDRAGVEGCAGVPKVCSPVWSAAAGAPTGQPVGVADGVVYIGSGFHGGGDGVWAYDAHAGIGAPPVKVLAAGSTSPAALAVVLQSVYVAASDGTVHVYR